MVPAVGQGAIAVQCREEDAPNLAAALDPETARRVDLERALQGRLGGGCQLAFAAHATADTLYVFHEQTGPRSLPLAPTDFDQPAAAMGRILQTLGL
jgi:hydroxymethylbilane synthase